MATKEYAQAEHRRFQEAFRAGRCFNCGESLTFFDRSRPCVHWYLNPAGFTKRDVPTVADAVGLFRTQLFMRWVANEEAMGRNINDLRDEGDGRLIELTIRYRDCEWSISCSDSDYAGHENGVLEAQRPHYHLQFRFRRQSFVKFNDFHLRLHGDDIDVIKRIKTDPKTSIRFAGGQSVADLFDRVAPEDLIKMGTSSSSEDEALLSLNTIIVADEGTTISGDKLADLFERARAKGVTASSLMPELENVSVQTTISPGPGVVEQSTRGGRGKKER